jgi:hypothetical protein
MIYMHLPSPSEHLLTCLCKSTAAGWGEKLKNVHTIGKTEAWFQLIILNIVYVKHTYPLCSDTEYDL